MLAKALGPIGLVILCLAAATPAPAKTKIEVPADARWQHARSKIILPDRMGDLPRVSIDDYSESELNLAAQYRSDSAELTVYIYRPYWANVGVWFERSEASIFSDKAGAKPQALGQAALAFARPGGNVTSGLRRAYSYGEARYRSSILAILPYGGWLMKIRYSAVESDIAVSNAVVDAALAAIKFPKDASEGEPVQQISNCAEPYKWKKAKLVRDDMMSAMLAGSTFAAMMEGKASVSPAVGSLCRMEVADNSFTLYRDTSDRAKFWMLIGDAGATAQIQQVKSPLSGGAQFWSILSVDTKHYLMPSLTGVPEPKQWLSVLLSDQIRATVTIDPDAPDGTKPETVINIAT